MGAILALLFIVAISLLVVRIGSNALVLTGMSEQAAKFQAGEARAIQSELKIGSWRLTYHHHFDFPQLEVGQKTFELCHEEDTRTCRTRQGFGL